VAVNSIYASIIPSYKYNLVLKSFSYGTQVMGHPVDVASFTLLNIPICDLIIYSSKSKNFLVLSMPFDEEFAKKRGIRVSNNYLNQVIHFACVHIFSFFAHCY
jgi:hypothetical protein